MPRGQAPGCARARAPAFDDATRQRVVSQASLDPRQVDAGLVAGPPHAGQRAALHQLDAVAGEQRRHLVALARRVHPDQPAELVLRAGALASVTAATGDAKLVGDCAAVLENERAAIALTADFVPGDEPPAVRAEEERLGQEWDALMERIVETPATTPAGIHAKAALARDTIGRYADGTPMLHCRRDQLVWSLFKDLLGEEAQ